MIFMVKRETHLIESALSLFRLQRFHFLIDASRWHCGPARGGDGAVSVWSESHKTHDIDVLVDL